MRGVTFVTLQNWFNHNQLSVGDRMSRSGKSDVASG
jgi:hypothetical protein